MKADSLKTIIDARKKKQAPSPIGNVSILKRIPSKGLSYTERHRGVWFRPEYDLREIEIAQDVESFLFRAIKKKTDRFMIAGWEFRSTNLDALAYIKRRFAEMELVTNQSFVMLLKDTVQDMFRFSNAMWVKARDEDASSGKIRVDLRGIELKPVAGYFLLPFPTLEFRTKPNGDLIEIKQIMDFKTKEFPAQDLVYFYSNKKPGFSIGTPEVLPAIDDLSLLRRLEENVEELIETSLFPTLHYQIGTDEMPERNSPNGEPESEIVKRKISYMPANAVYVSDHRHKITSIGAEGKALVMDFYLSYFKTRALSGLGVSSIDIGESDSSNRSTASTISKSLIQDVEAMQLTIKGFLEFYVISELLLEGGFNPLDEDDRVEINFGVIDKEDRTRLENQAIQLVANKLFTVSEGRAALGKRPYKEEELGDTYFKLFEEPLALLKSMGPGSAAGEVLSEIPHSNVTPEAIASEKKFAEAEAKAKGRPATNTSSTGSQRQSAARSRPSNQTGQRASPKFSRDLVDPADCVDLIAPQKLESLLSDIQHRVEFTQSSREAVLLSMQPRILEALGMEQK